MQKYAEQDLMVCGEFFLTLLVEVCRSRQKYAEVCRSMQKYAEQGLMVCGEFFSLSPISLPGENP